MKTRIYEIIMETIDEINRDREEKIDTSRGMDLILYGTGGVFTSMGLVNFLSTVESSVEDEYDISVSLASEKAVSRKVSPFSSVAALIAFTLEEIGEVDVRGVERLSATIG